MLIRDLRTAIGQAVRPLDDGLVAAIDARRPRTTSQPRSCRLRARWRPRALCRTAGWRSSDPDAASRRRDWLSSREAFSTRRRSSRSPRWRRTKRSNQHRVLRVGTDVQLVFSHPDARHSQGIHANESARGRRLRLDPIVGKARPPGIQLFGTAALVEDAEGGDAATLYVGRFPLAIGLRTSALSLPRAPAARVKLFDELKVGAAHFVIAAVESMDDSRGRQPRFIAHSRVRPCALRARPDPAQRILRHQRLTRPSPAASSSR